MAAGVATKEHSHATESESHYGCDCSWHRGASIPSTPIFFFHCFSLTPGKRPTKSKDSLFRSEISAQRGSFRPDVPADIWPKLRSGPPNSGGKKRIVARTCRADVHEKKVRSEKLQADVWERGRSEKQGPPQKDQKGKEIQTRQGDPKSKARRSVKLPQGVRSGVCELPGKDSGTWFPNPLFIRAENAPYIILDKKSAGAVRVRVQGVTSDYLC